MNDMTDIVQSNIRLFEECIMSENPKRYIEALPNSYEKKLLSGIMREHSETFQADIKELNLPIQLRIPIQKLKQSRKVSQSTNIEQVKYILKEKVHQMKESLFSFSKPSEFHSFQPQESHDRIFPSEFRQKVNIQEIMKKKLEQNERSFYTFTDYGIKSLPNEILLNLDLEKKQFFLRKEKLIKAYPPSILAQFLLQFYKQKRIKNNTYEFSKQILHFLSVQHLEELQKIIPEIIHNSSFLSLLFSLKFAQKLELYDRQLHLSELDEKRELLGNILEEIKKIKTGKLLNFKNDVLKQLLLVDLERQDVKQQLFVEFIEKNQSCYFNENHRQSLRELNKSKHNLCISLCFKSKNTNTDKLIQKYLEKLCLISHDLNIIQKLVKYFPEEELLKIYARTKLKQGEQVEGLTKILSQNEIRFLKNTSQITILEKTKKYFEVDEEVVLYFRVKNINTIKIKVYEVDLESHYIKESNDIEPKENLSYLPPNFVQIYEVDNSNPFKQSYHDLKMSELEKKRGVFIVELEGEDISSRAFVRKGKIIAESKTTSAGIELKFLNETGKQITDLCAWLEGRKLAVNESLIIPFGKKTETHEVLVMKDLFYEKVPVRVPAEEYNMTIGYIFGSESFIVGHKGKIVLHPRLYLETEDEEIQVSLALLKDIKVKIEMVNSQNIKSHLQYEKLEFFNHKDYILQIPIQSYLRTININVQATITKYTGEKVVLRDNRTINIDLGQKWINFIDFYLRKIDSSYYLFVFGKNGQEISNLEIRLEQRLLGIHEAITHQLMTDEKGTINLGGLELTERIKIYGASQQYEFVRQWVLKSPLSECSQVQNMIYEEGKAINVPFYQKNKPKDLFLFRHSQAGTFLSEQTNKCRIVDYHLIIQDLPEGRYELCRLATNEALKFQVIKSDKWQNQNQIYRKIENKVYQIPKNQSHQICLGDANIEEENDENIITIPLHCGDVNMTEKVRAHLYASNFMQPVISNEFNPSQFKYAKPVSCKKIQMPECLYFSNQFLGDEASYILNRQKEIASIGNNLQKPKIFLKNIELKETKEEEEKISQKQDYEKQSMIELEKEKLKKRRGCQQTVRYSTSARRPIENKSITSHNNFLQHSGWMCQNEKGEVLKFRVPKHYSHFRVFLLSDSNALVKDFSKGDLTVKKKSISHRGMIQENQKCFTMSRQVHPIYSGNSLMVSRSSTWYPVSLANIFGFARVKGVTLEEWVSNWQLYSQKQKEDVYDEKACHELNCYIKHHDQTFFQKVVRPFIKNKMKKTFVDHYLLGSSECEQWTSVEQYAQLNSFEKVLLVRYLMEFGKEAEARQIAKVIENEAVNNRTSFQNFKNQFQTVISAKFVEKSGGNEKMLLIEDKQIVDRYSRQIASVNKQDNSLENSDGSDLSSEEEKQLCCEESLGECYVDLRSKYRKGFKQMQKTKEYGERTYAGVKYESQSKSMIQPSAFWAAAARHFSSITNEEFVEKSFMYLRTKAEFTLAATLLPKAKNAAFDLETVEDKYVIRAKSSFLLFVKEMKALPLNKKFGVILNQRIFSPNDKYKVEEEDCTEVEKEVTEFVVCRPYCLQTIVTNTSGMQLEVQVLIDLPSGSIPLKSHEYTRIENIQLKPYTTSCFESFFYFPQEGVYQVYPANACRSTEIIGKAEIMGEIEVRLRESRAGKMECFADAMKSGDEGAILKYVEEKNIHDENLFQPESILWLLKEKRFYDRLMPILRRKKYTNEQIQLFSLLHEDLPTIRSLPMFQQEWELPTFEYHPFYSSRTHMFSNQNKSKIKNVQLRNSYLKLLFMGVLNNDCSPRFKITFVYYLLLQDRVQQAHAFFDNRISEQQKRSHQLQAHYIECFIDMYKGYPNFERARRIAPLYDNYPIGSWRKLFAEISSALKDHDGEIIIEEIQKEVYQPTYIYEEKRLRISMPEGTAVNVSVYNIKLEMYFSEFPFQPVGEFPSIKPSHRLTIKAGAAREEVIQRDDEWKSPVVVLMAEDKEGRKSNMGSFLWPNPKLQVKVREEKGQIQVVHEGKKLSGCYCKVYQMKHGAAKFYRDGYTDITGTFKYVLAALEGVTELAILVESQFGGRTFRVKPPSQQGYFS